MMYKEYNTPEELDNLKFSIWDKSKPYAHALFSGGFMATSYYLENNNINNLEVSALDLQSVESHEPVSAEQWLDWYYMIALSILEQTKTSEIYHYHVLIEKTNVC